MAFSRHFDIAHPSDPLDEFIEYLMPSWSVRPADPWLSLPSGSHQHDPRSSRSDADRGRGFLVRFPSRSASERPHRSDGAMDVKVTGSEFRVAVDVRNFQPEELDVKIIEDDVIIHGKHEERSDEHGHISREFVRRYKLPSDVDPNEVASSLSHDGVLSIKGKRKTNQPAERVIPISVEQKPQIEGASAEKEEAE